MSFTDPIFLLFLPLTVMLYRIFPQKHRWTLLLAASLLFYAWHSLGLLFLLLGVIFLSYRCALAMERAADAKKRRSVLTAGCLCILGALGIFKYLNFLLGSFSGLCRLFGLTLPFSGASILLPMGISFYSFQTLSYLLDVYHGKFPPEHHLGYYALFVTFFPQLVAGPIERPEHLLPQLRRASNPTRQDRDTGLNLLLRGYCKKLLLADFLAIPADRVYAAADSTGALAVLLGTLCFGIQIYCDFSGYCDIAQGCARLIGIRLSDNFRTPYRSRSLREFWRRWHISLSRWFTDYLYIPLGGSHGSALRTCRNLLITFLVSGLWHGADWSFVIWGGLHGLYLCAEHLCFRQRKPGRFLTLTAVNFAWVFFRSPSVSAAFTLLGRLFSGWQNALAGLELTGTQWLTLPVVLALLPCIENLPLFRDTGADLAGADREVHAALIYFFALVAIGLFRMMLLGSGSPSAFLYFQF